MICPPYHSVISIVHASKDTIILISFIGSSLRPLEKKPSDEDHGPRPLQYPIVNLVLKGYHSPLNWLFVPKNNDRTLSQNNECYTLLSAKPWCQREKWHFWGENVRVGNDYKTGKKLVILQNSLEKNLGDVTTHHTVVENSKKYRILSKVLKVYYADFGSDKNISGFFRWNSTKFRVFLDSIYAKCDILKSF